MFTVPIMEIAASVAVDVQVARDSQEALTLLAENTIAGVLLDMRISTEDLIQQIIAGGYPVAGFGPHVDGKKFLELRSRGVRELWPNSKLREKLPVWLRQFDTVRP